MLEMHAIFIGRVQGVGFRYTAKNYALGLGLVGSVRNRSDGTVELIAQGKKEVLEKLLGLLKEEAFPEYITDTKIEFSEPRETYFSFSIA